MFRIPFLRLLSPRPTKRRRREELKVQGQAMAKKNRYVEDVPGETAEERLQHYVQKAQQLPAQRPSDGDDDRTPVDDRPRGPGFVGKVFGMGIMGWIQLALVCIAAGAVFEASGINPFAPNFSLGGAMSAAATGALNVAGWAMQAGWRPLVTGAIVVLPLWLVCRLVMAAFRR